jgi:hypothetical protein
MTPLALGILSGLGAAAGAFVLQLVPANGEMVWPPNGHPADIAVDLMIVASVVASIVYSVTWEYQRRRAVLRMHHSSRYRS